MELTKQHAKDIDEMLRFCVEMGFLKNFDVSYYQRTKRPDYSSAYVFYLVDMLRTYMRKYDRKWVYNEGKTLACNNHTEAFCDGGGFMKIYEDEERQEMKEKIDLKLAQETLKTYGWTQLAAWIGFGVSIVLFVLQLLKIFKVIK